MADSNLRPEGRVPPTTYPMLMRCTDSENLYYNCVVLFTKKKCGTIVHSPKGREELGFVSERWGMEQFELYRGTVEITES